MGKKEFRMTKNDKGCCCLCPSSVGVILLSIWDAVLVIVAILALLYLINEDEKLVVYFWFGTQAIVFSAQIILMVATLIWRDEKWPRLTLFIFQVIASIWINIFFIAVCTQFYQGTCYVDSGRFCGIVDFVFFSLIIAYGVNLIITGFGLNCCW